MDISTTTAADSTQINADDLIGGPETYTVSDVAKGTSEQPVNIILAEAPGRAYRPSKSMRRVLVAAWGKDSTAYIGRRLTLYRDPDVTFAGARVGGIKISHLSHIPKRLEIALTVTRGKRAPHVIEPLPDAPTEPTADEIAACTDTDELRAMWQHAGPDGKAQIQARVAELQGAES